MVETTGTRIGHLPGITRLIAESPPRLGLILLATDLTSEGDFHSLLPPHVAAIHGTRVAFSNPTTPENLQCMAPDLELAASQLVPGIPLEAIAYCCTAASVVIGDTSVRQAIGRARPGVPVITPTGAAVQALRALRCSRIAILTPYLQETTLPVVEYFEAQGFEVVAARCLGLEDDRDMARVTPASILAAAEASDDPRAEALFISCTALPALPVVGEIEKRIGKPVVTSNQASIWLMRSAAGIAGPVSGFGRLFDLAPPDVRQ